MCMPVHCLCPVMCDPNPKPSPITGTLALALALTLTLTVGRSKGVPASRPATHSRAAPTSSTTPTGSSTRWAAGLRVRIRLGSGPSTSGTMVALTRLVTCSAPLPRPPTARSGSLKLSTRRVPIFPRGLRHGLSAPLAGVATKAKASRARHSPQRSLAADGSGPASAGFNSLRLASSRHLGARACGGRSRRALTTAMTASAPTSASSPTLEAGCTTSASIKSYTRSRATDWAMQTRSMAKPSSDKPCKGWLACACASASAASPQYHHMRCALLCMRDCCWWVDAGAWRHSAWHRMRAPRSSKVGCISGIHA